MPRRWGNRLILLSVFFLVVSLDAAVTVLPCCAGERLYAVNLYAARLTANHWEEFFNVGDGWLDFRDSYLLAATLARRIGRYGNRVSFEIEGQVVKHFKGQDHWEFNGLVAARWGRFWWDDFLETSLAFGLGPSFASKKPVVESEGQNLVYWMIELALGLPKYPQTAFIIRIHHRSNAFGLVGDEGGSNALACGLKYRF